MPRRISRKLLVGLGSIVTFGAVGTVSGFGIKSIIDSSLNDSKLNQLTVNTSQTGSLADIPNYNVATEDMFIKTQNLKRFHFGNTQIGQKITPWGWLGVFDDPNGLKTRIALTAWNGEIIWVNEDYKALDDLNVYDMQYDFNSNLIFVLRTKSANGFYDGNGQYPKVWLEVLDATTGKKYKDSVSDTQFRTLQEQAKSKLIDGVLLFGYDNDNNIKAKTKNLYYLDVTYSHEQKAILATWMPNYMQMARQSYSGTEKGSLPSFFDVINSWTDSATSFMFGIKKLENAEIYNKKQRKFNLLNSSGIEPVTDQQGKMVDAWIDEGQLINAPKVKASEIFLLANPFFTTSHDDKAFVMHLIGANADNGKVYHKTIGWKIDLTDSAKLEGEIYKLTVGADDLTDQRRYDNIEILANGDGYFDLKSDKSWSKAKGWNPAFINANLRVNKNMFDENSIVFAYPYSSSSDETNDSINSSYGQAGVAMPVFNVAQIWLDKKNAQFKKTEQSSKKFHINYDFGKQIDDYYILNNNGKNYADQSTNNIYPYPSPGSFDDNNINHLYNRLISVSPFDNTIIYAAKPNVREDIFSPHTTTNKDKWAGFWIANSWAWDTNVKKKYYHPLVVANDGGIVSNSDRYDATEMSYMLDNINDLYHDGFTFDISSRMDVDQTGRTTLNLYFNQTGSGVNDTYNTNEGFQSSKIGLLRDIIYDAGSNKPNQSGSKGWADNITPKFPGSWENWSKKLFATTINKDSFSSIIHSRADLKKWYPRTWANANFASNMLRIDEIFSMTNPEKFAVAKQFGQQLTGQDWVFGNKESIDLVTAWLDKTENNQSPKYRKRFERLVMKRPKIQAAQTAEENGLGLVTKYELPKVVFDSVIGKQGWEIANNQSHLTLTKIDTVKNTSVQILSAWGDSYKMKKIATKTIDINETSTGWKELNPVVEFLDKKTDPNTANNIVFGNGNNNNLTRNGAQALRLMLKIVKPSGNLPNWFTRIPEYVFNKAYPLQAAYQNETTFKDIVKEFADQKARNLDFTDVNTLPLGLANLKIDAYLELNPKFGAYSSNKDKIYNVTSGTLNGAKIIIDKKRDNQQFIYKDDSRATRTIYDQSSINYQDFANGGFTNSMGSWSADHELGTTKNIKVTTDYSLLADNLVRRNANDTTAIFSFDYQNGTNDKLEVTPTDQTWFANHFKNYNRMLGLFVQFQYQTATKNTWTNLGTPLGDQEISQQLQSGNKLVLSNAVANIKKLRFKLVKDPNPNSEFPVDMVSFDENNDKYISNEHQIASERYIVNSDQIQKYFFANKDGASDKYLNDINQRDLDDYVNAVVNASISSQDIKDKVTLKFEYNGTDNLSASELLQRLQAKINSNNPFAISANGTDPGDVIKAYFVNKSSNNGVTLVDENGQTISEANTKANVKSNLITAIDVGDYINQIIASGLIVNPPATTAGSFANNGNDIKFPDNQDKTGFLSNMSFEKIKAALTAVGVTIRYKGYDPTSSNFGNWQTDLTNITNYNPARPEIKIGFQVASNWKVEMFNSNTKFDENHEFTIKLNLPKQINIKDEYIANAKTELDFSGNTKNINFTDAKVTSFIQGILTKNDQAAGTNNIFTTAKLKILFNVGNAGFIESTNLKTQLAAKWNDLDDRSIKYKFEIDPGQKNDFVLANPDQTYELFSDDDSPLKLYINDKYKADDQGIFNSLKATSVSGSNTNLILNFINDISVDQTSGILSATNPNRGVGLKVEFTFNQNATNTTAGTDIETEWVSKMPTSFDSKFTDSGLWLRITLTNSNKYHYDFANQKFKLDLANIPLQINVDPQWLNQTFTQTEIILTEQEKLKQGFQNYEAEVWLMAKNANLADVDKNKMVIKYDFNGNENLTLDQLIVAIQNYQTTTKAQTTILQLWNGNSGEKITSKFAKANDNGNYEFNFNGSPNQFEINFEKVITKIDFSKVLSWLKTLEIKIEEEANNVITALKIPNVEVAQDQIFNGKSWDDVQTMLEQFGITIEYSNNISGQTDKWGPTTASVNKYDPKNPSFKIRFTSDGKKSKNIKFKLDNNELDGATSTNSQAQIIKIKARLLVEIPQDKIDEFKTSADISGNTKVIEIQNAQSAEEKLIQAIIDHNSQNDSRYQDLKGKLKLQYIMQKDAPNASSDWKSLTELKNFLSSQTDDQITNKIWYRFNLEDQTNFSLDANFVNPIVLSDHVEPNDAKIKIKYYVNEGQWEENAKKIIVSGTNDNLEWNFDQVFQKANVNETNDHKVYLRTKAGQALQVYFTLNANATYDNPNDLVDDASQINNKWVSIKPTALAVSTKSLKIKLVANPGFVYGPQESKTAAAHDVPLNFQSVIYVKNEWLNKPLVSIETEISALSKATHFDVWEQAVREQIKQFNQVDDEVANKIKIKYILKSVKYESQDLLDELLSLRQDYNDNDLGIIKLWNNSDASGIKIEAIFESGDNKYTLKVDQNSSTPPTEDQLKSQLNTDNVYTSISMVNYLKFLSSEQNKTDVERDPTNANPASILGFSPPTMSGNIGDSFLSGRSYDEIAKRLKDLGVDILFSKEPNGPWSEKEQIKEYDIQKNALFMAFEIKSKNIKIQLTNVDSIGFGQNNKNNPTKLPLNVKKYILIDTSKPFWQSIKTDFGFSGNTKEIEFNETKINEFLTAIKNDNFDNSANDQSYKNAPLEIQFQIGNLAFTKMEELKQYLQEQKIDLTSRSVHFKFAIKDGYEKAWDVINKQTGTNDEHTLLTDDEADNKIKIFINDNGFEKQGKDLQLSGSTESFTILGENEWIAKKPNGLNIWWSADPNPADNSDDKWSQSVPTKLDSANPVLWFHFKIDQKYVYEKAKDEQGRYLQYSQKQSLDISNLKIILKVEKDWLKLIEMTGNFKTPDINEKQVKDKINNAAILPNNKPNLLQLQYRIKGTKEWMLKDQFINKLKSLNGSKDAANFILKREELEIRFNIDPREDKYGLDIDNTVITDDNRDDFNVQIIDDNESRNTSFEGYINLDLLTDFDLKNFSIQGSTSKPQLIIDHKTKLDTLLMPYQSDGLFDVIYSTDYDEQNQQWKWDQNKTILLNGKFIEPDDLWQKLNVTISAKKKFAIKFISKKSHQYKVYKGDQKYDDGYVLDLSNKIRITVEIENPFSANQKTLGIWTRENNKQAKYYQGKGGFKIVVATKNDLEVENKDQPQSAQEFLESSSLHPDEKKVLEFVYHNFGLSASKEEIARVEKAIKKYDDPTWQSFDSIKAKANDDWSKEIGLKVGDYVAVAIRVKKEYATGDEPFVLKGDDYSMILPVMNDQNGAEKRPGRISGYKINTNEINIEKNSVVVANMVSAELPPLDGWSELQRLNLVQDQLGNYLGVDLKLQLYTTFHKDATGKILTSGSGLKLVERQTSADSRNIISTGTYKDGKNQDITDQTGKKVEIWKYKDTKRLSAPKKSATATSEKLLTAVGNGAFRLFVSKDEQNKFSLFRNQDLTIKVEASQGDGSAGLPDFYLDNKDKKIEIKDQVSDQIKFIVENEKKITYGWNQEEFLPDKIQYKHPSNSPDKKPEDGNAQIATIYKLFKKESEQIVDTISGTTPAEASKKIEEQLEKDFDGQLKFETTYINKKGTQTQVNGNDIYQFHELNNRDRIMVKIVAKADDLFYVTNEAPLIINVNGLIQAAPNADKLQHLRVKQGGIIDGQGSFKILVSDPNNANEDERQILKGWKFMIRVWDKSTEIDPKTNQRKIKIDWTDDQARIKNLANGDRVEWKLVSEEGNPVKEAYYNTIALEHKQNSDGSINYKFAQVNYPAGDGTYEVVKPGVGDYPEDETKYPEDSGFVISGLKSAVDIFQISKENFAKVMQKLNPTYVGINKQGTIKMEPKYFEDKYWVNSEGELFIKDQQATLQVQDQEQTKKEIPLTEFLDNVTFYTHDPVLANYQGGFKFSGNDVNNNNHLTNGDQVWATFDMLNESDENIIINGNEMISSVTLQLSDVSGLKEVIDPMSPLWYVLMALAGVVTLGTAALIAFLMTRHKKLKGK